MKVVVEAYGCTMSMGEGERFKRELAALGHEIVDRPDEADNGDPKDRSYGNA